ncbi:unnamed protein product [Vicia faba]|uniref:Uncharacterized protein n=1 Tax=Vicia faba TaxID=3906 RepID=A0AAV0ZUB8_VICFA|nr:unnamed protein product [Vicia faba]
MNYILDLTNPKDVLENLKNQYMSKMLMNKFFTKQCLYSLEIVKVDDEDKYIILRCYLPSSYNHLMTTLTYEKETVMLDSTYFTLLKHAQNCQSIEEGGGSSSEGLSVKEGQSRGRGKAKVVSSGKKRRFNSKDRKTTKYYGYKKIGHCKRDCPNKSGNNSSTNVVHNDGFCSEEDLICNSSIN